MVAVKLNQNVEEADGGDHYDLRLLSFFEKQKTEEKHAKISEKCEQSWQFWVLWLQIKVFLDLLWFHKLPKEQVFHRTLYCRLKKRLFLIRAFLQKISNCLAVVIFKFDFTRGSDNFQGQAVGSGLHFV